jgi:hypothetical protein
VLDGAGQDSMAQMDYCRASGWFGTWGQAVSIGTGEGLCRHRGGRPSGVWTVNEKVSRLFSLHSSARRFRRSGALFAILASSPPQCVPHPVHSLWRVVHELEEVIHRACGQGAGPEAPARRTVTRPQVPQAPFRGFPEADTGAGRRAGGPGLSVPAPTVAGTAREHEGDRST